MADFAVPSTTFQYTTRAPTDHHSLAAFDEINGGSDVDEYAHTPASGVVDLAFSPWLLEVPTCMSPVSRTSSLSGSECMATPPYLDQPSVYHPTSQPQPLVPEFIHNNSSYAHNSQHNWPQQFTGAESCAPPLPMWYDTDYGSHTIPSMNYYAQPYLTNATSSTRHSTAHQAPDTDQFKASGTVSSNGSGSGSDSDSDDSEYEDGNSSYNRQEGSRTTSAARDKDPNVVAVMKLGKWSMAVDPIISPEARLYVCPMNKIRDASGRPCENRFVRPEHLRRHMKTVHGSLRAYECKVPRCDKAFSRGDNLRDHYWTHLERGGRAGKNEKMSLEELKAILGPKEKKLAKKLKHKLAEQKKKKQQVRAKL